MTDASFFFSGVLSWVLDMNEFVEFAENDLKKSGRLGDVVVFSFSLVFPEDNCFIFIKCDLAPDTPGVFELFNDMLWYFFVQINR